MATQVKNGIMPKKKRFSLVTYIKETKQELKREIGRASYRERV